MPGEHKIISADCHAVEPPNLFEGRVGSKYKDQVPRVVRGEVRDEWRMGDEFMVGAAGVLIQAGRRVANSSDVTYGQGNTITKSFGQLSLEQWKEVEEETARWEFVPPGAYDPKAQLKDNELDGVYGAVVYPGGLMLTMFRRPSSPLMTEMFRAYNDWIAEFSSVDNNRLVGNALILLDDVEASVKELHRCHKMGLRAAQIPAYPEPHLPYSDPMYEPFWEAAEGLEIPLAMHIQSWRPQPVLGQFGPQMAALEPEVARFIGEASGIAAPEDASGRGAGVARVKEPVDRFCTTDFYIRRSTGEMIFSGVFGRHPNLQVVCVEFDTGFVPYHLSRMDHTYFEFPDSSFNLSGGKSGSKNEMMPSEYWQRNVKVTFQEDPLGLQRLRDLIGPQTMLWGNDYPHRESTWPESLQRIEETFKGVPQDEREMITGGTSARLWKIK